MFCENSWRLLAVNYFRKMIQLRCLTGFWIHFCICYTAQKIKISIKDLFSKCDQICSFLRIWSHILKKSLMENFIFCAVLNHFKGEKPRWNQKCCVCTSVYCKTFKCTQTRNNWICLCCVRHFSKPDANSLMIFTTRN